MQHKYPAFSEYLESLFSANNWSYETRTETDQWISMFSDITISIACFIILFFSFFYLKEKIIAKGKWFVVLLSLFIVLCISRYLLDVVAFWLPIYHFSAILKLISAVLSIALILSLVVINPAIFNYKSSKEVNKEIRSQAKVKTQLELFIYHSPGAYAMFDKDMQYITTNANWIKYYQLEDKEFVGKSYIETLPETLETHNWHDTHTRALSGEVIKKERVKFITKASTIYLNFEISPWKHANGEIGGVTIFTRDVTDEFKTKEKLQLEELKAIDASTRLIEISQVAKIGFWDFRLGDSHLQWNNTVYDIHGIKRGEKIFFKNSINYYHPDYRPLIKNAVENAIKHKKNWDIELRLINQKNEEIWVRAIGRPLFDENNRVTGLDGLFLDIDLRKRTEIKIAELNANLEEMVEEIIEELNNSQKQLIESEKMASLGQLIAGIGHEINTPMAAIKASAESLQETNEHLFSNFENIKNIFDSGLSKEFNQVTHESYKKDIFLSTKQEREAKQHFRKTFESIEIPNKKRVQPIIEELKLFSNWEQHMDILSYHNNVDLLDIVLLLTRQNRSTKTIITAIEKSRKTIFALKSFSRADHNEKANHFDLNKSIDNVLVLYENQIKQGISIKRFYDTENLEIEGFQDSLNQVWSNLIHNAIQAMKLNGTLTIRVKQDGDNVNVNIEDTGEGIPKENESKIFKPFFTTKDKENGSGLGLDIVKKVIALHNGKIKFKSIPANTIFTITLPLKHRSRKK